jgi:hypothetical protein
MISRRAVLLSGGAVATFSGCADAPKPKPKEPEKPAVPVTGRFAFYQMYGSARLWSPDVQGLEMMSLRLTQVKDEPGKSGAWQVSFVSPGKQKVKTFTYSVVEGEGNLHKGVFAGLEESYLGPRGQSVPWNIQAFKIDSDAAYETALKKSAAYVKQFPDKPITFLLAHSKQFPDLSWRVVWGESVTTSDHSVYVDASTGAYLETTR